MSMLRESLKPVCYFVMFGFLSLTLHAPLASAALIGTESIVNTEQTMQARDHVRAMLERDDVKQALSRQGVGPDQIQARVDALTDDEVQQLAANMDKMPAGGDPLAIGAFVFLVLLLTDILGYTDIFPFVKKPAKQ